MLIDSSDPLKSLTLSGVRTDRAGPPLLFLHGLIRRWQTFQAMLPALAMRWQVHALDARGHGASARAAGGYLVTDYVEDIVELTDERFEEPVAIYGHSLGGMVALGAAAARPDRVRAVILEDPPFETMGRRIVESPWLSFFAGIRPFAGDPRPVADVTRDLAEIPIAAPGGTPARLGDLRDETSLRFSAWCLKSLDARALEPVVAGEWLTGYDLGDLLARVRCPVLLLQADGTHGGMLRDEDVRLARETARDMTCVRFPGAGHVLHWQRAEEVLRHTIAFLASLND
jgi:pimeloyl-ACP methyl ester carboxylesterase